MEEANLSTLKGIGPASQKSFELIGISTVSELINYFPRSYNDFSKITKIKSIKPGQVTIKAVIKQVNGRYVRRGMHVTEAIASDDSGSVKLVWFNQPYRINAFKPDMEYFITGKLEFRAQRYSITSPSAEIASDLPVHTARIVPVYRESRGVNTRLIRKTMAEALRAAKSFPDVLPADIIKKYKLQDYKTAVTQLHFPDSLENLNSAQRTMSFIEIFELMLASKLLKREIDKEIAPLINFDEDLAKKFVRSLPFELTPGQRRAAWQVLKDIGGIRDESENARHNPDKNLSPANRLVEGDVGSGKTIVAAMAVAMAVNSGYQAVFLAPTELLAKQHAESLEPLLKNFGIGGKMTLLVGSMKKSQKESANQRLKSGEIKLAVGTHALLQGQDIPGLGLIIIDEQHRFGVEQRKKLLKQNGKVPHVISMTATPIPRSLALTLYGELDISLLDSMPPGRKKIETKIVSPNSRADMEEHIRKEISHGHQAYVVCPVILENNNLNQTSAESTYKRLSQTVFKAKKVGLLHGKMKSDEKNQIMDEFVAGKIDILVSTTVIEVGVNVPNATIMVIEGADRFGLAQLHQLRGRVGRSSDQAFCYVVPSDSKAPSRRLRVFSQTTDGFKLAEMDLELRGPGAIYGTLQHGELDLRFASLTDHKLIAEARRAVDEFIASGVEIDDYPELSLRVRSAQAVVTLN